MTTIQHPQSRIVTVPTSRVAPIMASFADSNPRQHLQKRMSVLRENLTAGFASLPPSYSNSSSIGNGRMEGAVMTSIAAGVTVSFVDPSTSSSNSRPDTSSMTSMPSAGAQTPPTGWRAGRKGLGGGHSASIGATAASIHNLYSKWMTIFQRDYSGTLNSVPYKNPRSGASEVIERIPIRCVLTGGGGGGDASAPWGGAPAVTDAPVSDPAEWHLGPYCHVYIATCESMEHYRQKVRPALQAFVAQIEGGNSGTDGSDGSGSVVGGVSSSSASGGASRKGANEAVISAKQAAHSAAKGNTSSQYLIIYVPTGTGSSSNGPLSSSSVHSDNIIRSSIGGVSVMGGAAGGLLRGRISRRITQDTPMVSDSTHSTVSMSSSNQSYVALQDPDDASVDTAAAPPPGAIVHSSKAEKDLHRKFTIDFPNGRTCMLSTLMHDDVKMHDDDNDATYSPLKNQEWNALLRALGGAIVSGFRDRVRRYDEELRRLDMRRGGAAGSVDTGSPAVSIRKGSGSGGIGVRQWQQQLRKQVSSREFDLSHFFLVKESLAFTYEQMQLPDEALLQYEELEAFIPDGRWVDDEDDDDDDDDQQTKDDGNSHTSVTKPATNVDEGKEDSVTSSTTSSITIPVSVSPSPSASVMANAGDTLGFRKKIRSASDMSTISHLVLQYLFARETHLLFSMHRPMEVISRAHRFVKTLYQLRMERAKEEEEKEKKELPGTEPDTDEDGTDGTRRRSHSRKHRSSKNRRKRRSARRRRAEAEFWALDTCWDVKRSCDQYFSFAAQWGPTQLSSDEISESIESNNVVKTPAVETTNPSESLAGNASSPSSEQLASVTVNSQMGGIVAATEAVGAAPLPPPPPASSDMVTPLMKTRSFVARPQTISREPSDDGSDPEVLVDEEEREASRVLGDLLEFARLCLLRLGDSELPISMHEGAEQDNLSSVHVGRKNNPVREATAQLPQDVKIEWKPWAELSHQIGSVDSSNSPTENDIVVDDKSEPEKDKNVDAAHEKLPSILLSSWLRKAFSSKRKFTETYLELTSAIIALNNHASRYRFAARLQAEQAEILIMRKEYAKAAQTLLPIVDNCAYDHWDKGYFWRLFRLASCQRIVGDAPGYLHTLTKCFNRRLLSVAPPKAAECLQRDLEAIVDDPNVSRRRLGISPFLEMEIVVEPTTTGKSSHSLGFIRKKIVKHFCFVGDTISLAVAIASHLPRPIIVDSIRVILLSLDRYEAVYREEDVSDGQPVVSDKYAFRFMLQKGPIEIRPGTNIFKFEWIPMTVGQFVLASAEIQWKQSTFSYDSASLRRPVMGVDVLPSEPTQTIELNPLFLIPGHIQQVRLVFHSGKDIVRGGRVELVCSEGLQIVPPGTDLACADGAWCGRCSFDLESCNPNDKLVITTTVKSLLVKKAQLASGADSILQQYKSQRQHASMQQIGHQSSDDGAVQTMRAKVSTSYHHGMYDDLVSNGDEPKAAPMTTLLEAMVTTLDRPALTVYKAEAYHYHEDLVMVSVTLNCNTPVPFFLKEWDCRFPPPLSVIQGEEGDLNKGQFEHAVAEGEELFFAFRCIRHSADSISADGGASISSQSTSSSSIDEPHNRPILHVILEDEFGKTFRQVLQLDLDDFYAQMRTEDEYASTNTATAELDCAVKEGVVGAPVAFTYRLDLSHLTAARRKLTRVGATATTAISEEGGGVSSRDDAPLLFSISFHERDWILAGKVHGVLDRSKGRTTFDLDFVGIPTRSGVLKRFPEIELQYHRPSKSLSAPTLPPISVNHRYPDSFKSSSYMHHMALAYNPVQEV